MTATNETFQKYTVIQFNKNINMNAKFRNEKNDFEKAFFKLMSNSVLGKTMKNLRNHRDIKLGTTDKRRWLQILTTTYQNSP